MITRVNFRILPNSPYIRDPRTERLILGGQAIRCGPRTPAFILFRNFPENGQSEKSYIGWIRKKQRIHSSCNFLWFWLGSGLPLKLYIKKKNESGRFCTRGGQGRRTDLKNERIKKDDGPGILICEDFQYSFENIFMVFRFHSCRLDVHFEWAWRTL